MKRRRILAALFLLMGLANLLRATLVPEVQTVVVPEMLSVPLAMLGTLYGLFGLGFTVLAVLLWLGRAGRWPLPFALAYQLVLWIVRFVGYCSPFARSLWARDLVLTVVFVFIVFILTRKGHVRTKDSE